MTSTTPETDGWLERRPQVVDDLNRIERELDRNGLYGASQTMICALGVIDAQQAEILRLRSQVPGTWGEAVEQCAKVAQEFPFDVLQLVERPGGPPGNYRRQSTGSDIAEAIRALAASPSPPEQNAGTWRDGNIEPIRRVPVIALFSEKHDRVEWAVLTEDGWYMANPDGSPINGCPVMWCYAPTPPEGEALDYRAYKASQPTPDEARRQFDKDWGAEIDTHPIGVHTSGPGDTEATLGVQDGDSE